MIGMRILVRGIVQGVGFRPFVYNLAEQHNLTGWVRNSSRGVEIEVNGPPESITAFTDTVRSSPPPLARIDHFEATPYPPDSYTCFEILHSATQPGEFLPVSPDMTICPDCKAELFDPNDRRYRYPFINCTDCGPRFSIIRDIPYDRPNTTMAGFSLCPECLAEYENPRDRRFHAQPVACPVCGPCITLETGGRAVSSGEQALQAARRMLADGKILAVKGLGGYHLACDAANPNAVDELRRRKQRSEKPFAVMAFDIDAAVRYCQISPEDRTLLQSRQRPITLLPPSPGSRLAESIAPGQSTLGVMLAYTPLHLLLLEPAEGYPDLLVMTSGNLSEEPIAFDDDDARLRLGPLVDAFLTHDRPIHMRVDDSLARTMAGQSFPLRRARGYAPDPINLVENLPPILATGAELKNTFCLTRQRYAFVSHHIGDLENYETLNSFETGIEHYQRLFRIHPELLACDLHPDYLATRYAEERAAREGLPLVHVQHHHAHLAACLAENGWTAPEPVIGFSFDGTGYGSDGTLWGGEVLVGGYQAVDRRFHLAPVPQPGGDLAVRRPSRMALAHLWAAGLDWETGLPPLEKLCAEEQTVLRSMLEHRINTPLTSSLGRLFDAVASLLGVRQSVNYEGQAAMELEALADPHEPGCYEFDVREDQIDPAPLLTALISGWRAGLSVPTLAARFHHSIAALVRQLACQVRAETGSQTVALSGGVWQNRFLLERSLPLLNSEGFTVLLHHQLPPNDGSICLGQALVAYKQYQ